AGNRRFSRLQSLVSIAFCGSMLRGSPGPAAEISTLGFACAVATLKLEISGILSAIMNMRRRAKFFIDQASIIKERDLIRSTAPGSGTDSGSTSADHDEIQTIGNYNVGASTNILRRHPRNCRV